MIAIMKREFSSFFVTPVGYVILAIYWFFTGMYFTSACISEGASNLTSVFGSSFFVLLFIIPLMTMRSFSEEKKQKTDRLLITSPVGISSIVMGKFMGALMMFAACLSIFVVYGVVLSFFGDPNWSLLVSSLLGILLFGTVLIAIGIFISSLTENQIIAAIVTLAIGVLIYLIDTFAAMISVSWLQNFLLRLSFVGAYTNFSAGIINISDIVFDVSVTALFLFLTVRVLNMRHRAA